MQTCKWCKRHMRSRLGERPVVQCMCSNKRPLYLSSLRTEAARARMTLAIRPWHSESALLQSWLHGRATALHKLCNVV